MILLFLLHLQNVYKFMDKSSRQNKWNEVTHIIRQNEYIFIYYINAQREILEVEQYSLNSLLLYNENFVRVNYNTIVNKKFINSIHRIRRKIVLLIDKTEVVVSRRKSYYFK